MVLLYLRRAKPWSNKISAKEWIADLKESKFSKSDDYVEFLKEKSEEVALILMQLFNLSMNHQELFTLSFLLDKYFLPGMLY